MSREWRHDKTPGKRPLVRRPDAVVVATMRVSNHAHFTIAVLALVRLWTQKHKQHAQTALGPRRAGTGAPAHASTGERIRARARAHQRPPDPRARAPDRLRAAPRPPAFSAGALRRAAEGRRT